MLKTDETGAEAAARDKNENQASVFDVFPSRDKSQTAVETVVATIRQLLIDRKLRPGDLLPSENEIAATLSISRGSIREAMKILSAFGVVEIRRGNGTYVATSANKKLFDPLLFNLLVTHQEIGELAELRILVEEGIIRLIIEHATDADLDELEVVYEEMRTNSELKNSDPNKSFDTDKRFHGVMGKITHNKLVGNVYNFVIDLLAPTMRPGFGLETHFRLLEALRARNLDRSLAMIREHDDIWRKLNINVE